MENDFEEPSQLEITPPPLPSSQAWGLWGALGCTAAVLTVYYAIQVLVYFLFSGADLSIVNKPFSGFALSLAIVVSTPLCMWLVLRLARKKYSGDKLEFLALKPRPPLTKVLKWLLPMVLLMVLEGAFLEAVGTPDASSAMLEIYKTASSVPLFFLAIGLIGPAFEEMLFRGFLFKAIEGTEAGTKCAVVITAAFWSVVHMQYDVFGIMSIFAIGLLLGVARARTGSLFVTYAMHCMNNVVALVFLELSVRYAW